MRAPHVCVLLSTFNGERHLDAQLQSLRAQTGARVSLHVRDDGSADASVAILQRHIDRWPELANVPSGPNLGAARSFLELLRTAPDADYYAFCDQDDVWLPGKLARAAEALLTDPMPALYCSNVACVAEDLKVLGVPRANGDTRLQHLLFENIAYGCTTVMNGAARALIVQRLPEQGLVMHDWWCALVVAALGRIHYDPQPAILYRQHGANAVGSDADRFTQVRRQGALFLRDPGGFYRIHGQAEEFLRLYELDLHSEQRAMIERLVHSRRSVLSRLSYALSGQVIRNRLADAAVVRALVAAGWY
jgi:glycosyltransferase involved in cell wall biosynthesis